MDKQLFADFINATIEVFRFLEAEHDFERSEAFVHSIECSIDYTNSTTLLSVTHEGGGQIWILVSEMTEKGERVPPFYVLGKLIKRVSPERERAIDPYYVFDRRSRENLAKNLEAYADFLRKEGRGILKGDFSLFKPEDRLGRPSA